MEVLQAYQADMLKYLYESQALSLEVVGELCQTIDLALWAIKQQPLRSFNLWQHWWTLRSVVDLGRHCRGKKALSS